MKVILSSTSGVGAAACLFVFFASSSATAAAQQIYETSNDPSSLCIDGNSIKLTGYKATKDCRGYVYCNEGYLMGGGIIPCWPNQLFDESAQACTYWQNVDTSSNNCPEFDGSKLMPDQYDDNANEERFFCGQSWTHAKSICEPCPGGSRLECSTLGHTCFAGVTGCPTTSNTNGVGSSSNSNNNSNNNNGINSNSQPVIQGQPQPHPAIVFVEPNTPSSTATATASFTSSSNNNDNASNKECTTHSDCPSNKFCNEGYCGQCSKEGIGCSVDQVCRTASCHVTQTPGPGKCYDKKELHSFCAVAWKDERYQCNLDLMVCENSSLSLGGGGGSSVQEVATPTQDTTTTTTIVTKPESTNTNSQPLYTNPTGNNYFCGYSFATLTSACLQSKPCPHGFASKVCDDTEGCFRSDQCADEYEAAAASTASSSASSVSSSASNENTVATTTNQQQQQQQQQPSGSSEGLSQEVFTNTPPSSQAVVVTSPESPSNSWINGINKQCTSHDDCTTGQFCNEGYCGECSKEGIGCSVDQVCRTASCHVTQTPGPGKCYLKEELHSFCRNARKDENYQCNLDLMVCLPTQVTVDTQTTPKDPSPPSSSSSSSSLVSVISTSTEATTSPPSSQPTKTPSKASSTPRPTTTNAQTNKCSICGDLQVVDSDATIFYEGTELSCSELEDKVFIEDGVTMGSDICLTSRELYSATCCIDPPKDPCNLCRSGDNNFPLKSNVKVVSMTGETQSCIEVSQSLLARREQSSWQCRSSQKELQAKCCDGTTFDDNNTDESSLEDYNNVPVPTPGVNWSPLGGDEPAAGGYPSDGFYYAKPDWNWKEEWTSSSRISRTTSTIALFSIIVGGLLWQ